MDDKIVATFSIVGFDPETKEWGVAVQSKFVAVGAVCPWAKAGVGAISTQSYANTSFGPRGLDLLAAGKSAQEVLDILLASDPGREKRQDIRKGPQGGPDYSRGRGLDEQHHREKRV